MVENNYYERKIKYLDLMESGERTGGAGFVKIEVKGMEINLLINVKGLHPTDTYEREVLLQTDEGESSAGRIALKEGQGQFQYHMAMDHTRLQGIRIALGGTRELTCKLQEGKGILPMEKSRVRKEAAQESGRRDTKTAGSGIGLTGFETEAANSETGPAGFETEADSSETESTGFETEAASSGGGLTGSRPGIARSESKPSGTGAERLQGEKQDGSRKSREIQVIPWDEVKAVEESLERVERIMSRQEEKGAWEAAEKTARPTEKTARPTEKTARSTEKTARPEEKTAGPTEKTARPTEKTARSTEKTVRPEEQTTRPEEQTTRSEEQTMRPEEKMKGSAEKAIWPAEKTTKPVRRQASGGTLGSVKRPVRLMEDKWQQIWAIYPHIHPFRDEREYLSVGPADFVLLPEEAYRAANNSFLLHGYYNYDHLILTRIEKRGEISYYIGVPGNYYEREKQVALMFGFESFECGTEPAQAGDFGYYMMRTQL